jgi:hypothetical protein
MSYGHVVLSGAKTGFTSKAIKFFTGSLYSHSLITIPSIVDTEMCMEAADCGVSCLPFNKGYRQDPTEIYSMFEINVPQEIKDEAITQLLDLLEQSYGYFEIPWFMWRALNLKFGRDIKNQDNWSQKGTICSELCVLYLKLCGFSDLFRDFGEGSVCPQDLSEIMKAHPEYFTLIEERLIFKV